MGTELAWDLNTTLIYPDADRGFKCDERPSDHAEALKDAWVRTSGGSRHTCKLRECIIWGALALQMSLAWLYVWRPWRIERD
jgi:hypothetical protein